MPLILIKSLNLRKGLKTAIHKSSIPSSRIFVIKDLDEQYFNPVWHSHPEYQLFLVEEGTGTRFIGDGIRSFSPGELVFTGPHLPHLWRSDETYFQNDPALRSKGIVIYLKENFLGGDILGKEEFVEIKKLLSRSMRGLEFFGQKKMESTQLMRALTRMDGIESVIQLLQLLNVLAECKDYQYISPIAYEIPLKQSETDRMNAVYEYIFKNYGKKLALGDLASLLHMTPTSFSRYFSSINNKPFSKFISEIRIKHACKMLTETEESVSRISYDCGFNTLSNFNKQFKEIMSKNPLAYKKQFMDIQ